ncbi:MAG TPA: phosphatase PAP2 family protein [Terriglobales bacterium]|jgi:hypothetical protein
MAAQPEGGGSSPFRDLKPSTSITVARSPALLIGKGWSALPEDQPGNSDTTPKPFVTRTLHRFGQDQAEIFAAPFRRSNIKWDVLFAASEGALIPFDEQIERGLPTTHLNLSHNIGNAMIASMGVASAAVWLTGIKTGNAHARETGNLEIEALANTFTVYTLMQLIAGRQRPDEGTGEGSFLRNHSVNTSYPGGHVMFTFAMATVIAHEYPKRWVQILSYGAATTIGAARFTGRNHFASDVFAGGILGYFIGTHIFHSRCKVGLSSACSRGEP